MKDKYNNNPGFFSEEELMKCEPGNLWSDTDNTPQSKGVTCLGMTFPNDEARRAYFRDELRKKLPELRHIEGFPIGEDDDIINLSDPPYYTACPNPWLNDFIAEWEKEKEQLKAEGKRTDDFEVKEPYASDVSEGRSNPIYLAHTYHTKVPHPAIMRYILHYTQPGDIVFDGFCGTGMTGIAATLCGNESQVDALNMTDIKLGQRHAICSDLSPLASSIAAYYNTHNETPNVIREANRILKELEEEYGWMYETKNDDGTTGKLNLIVWTEYYICPQCGATLSFWDNVVSHEKKAILDEFPCPHCHVIITKKCDRLFETKYDEALRQTVRTVVTRPVYVVYTTPDGKRHERKANDYDLELIDKINRLKINGFYPLQNMPEGDKTRDPLKQNYDHVHQFYTKRNLVTLSYIWSKINQSKYKNKLYFVFTGFLARASVMNRFSVHNYFFGGGGWNKGILNGTLYVPAIPIETTLFVMLKSRIDSCKSIADLLPSADDNLTMVASACKLPIKDESIDYIFIDPPFGANIMYSELNFLSEAWLKVFTNNKTEAIVNKTQHKSLFEYQTLMNRSLKEFYRILKPNKWITIEFSNTSASVWNSIQNALQGVGFVVTSVASLDKKQGSFNAVTTTTAVKQDLVITCYKPTDELLEKFNQSEDKVANVWDFIGELLEHLPVHLEKNNKTTAIVERSPKILFDRLIAYYVQHGYPVPMDAQAFQAGLRERYIERDGMFFTADQAAEYDEKKKHAPEMVSLGLIVSDEASGIEWLRNQLREQSKTYQEIQPEWMQSLGGLRKGDILPELKQLLEENFIEEADGKWRLPNIQDDKDVEALRTKSLLREFKVYVEACQKPKAKIKEARVEALRAGFKDCYVKKDFQTIVNVGDKIPQNLRDEDEVLLQFYDIAQGKL